VSTKPALSPDPPATEPAAGGPPPSAADVRAVRPYILSRSPLRSAGRRLASVLTLAAIDVCGVALGLYGGLTLRELWHGHTDPLWGVLWDAETEWLPFLSLITLLVFWQAGLYASRERRAGVGKVVSSLVIVALITLAFGLGTGFEFTTYGLIPTSTVLAALAIGIFRAAYETAAIELLRLTGARRRAVLVGHGPSLERLRESLGSARGGIDYEFVGAVAPSVEGVPLPLLGGLEELPAVLAGRSVDELILSEADFDEAELLEIVETAHRHAVKVRLAPTTTELLVQRGEYVPGQGVPLFELRPPVFAGTDWAVKRSFDLLVSGALMLAGLPLWLLVAAAIKLDSRGPVFYRDPRIGLGEREFGMFKFRTMVAGADRLQPALEGRNEADGALFKIRHDPRVTRVGRLLRRVSLDELPQVLNVLRGEMSLVGPRPLPLRDYALLEDWHRKRYLVLPGMTGLWQISGRSGLTFDDLVRLDFYYLDNWSIWLDISILVKTPAAVLARKGAY